MAGLSVLGLIVASLCGALVWIAARNRGSGRGFLPRSPFGWLAAVGALLLVAWTVIGVAGWAAG